MFMRAQFSSQISSITDYLVSFTLVNAVGVHYEYATLFGNISGGIVNCIINYRWTFKAKGTTSLKHVAIKYLMVWLVNLFLNWQGTIFVTEFVMKWIPVESLPDFIVNNIFMVPKAMVSLVVGFVWNYNMQRLFVYKDRDFRKFFRMKPSDSLVDEQKTDPVIEDSVKETMDDKDIHTKQE